MLQRFIESVKTTQIRPGFVILLASAIILAIWLPDADKRMRNLPEETPPEADQFMDNPSIVELNANGRPFRWLKATHMAYFSDETTHLNNPDIRLVDKDNSPAAWTIKAKYGVITNHNYVYLSGNVNIHKHLDQNDDTMIINTSNLHVYLDQNIGTTENEVTVSSKSGKVSATGMTIDINKQTLRLLSKVHGNYDAP